MSAELLVHADVTGATVRILRRAGIAKQDMNDCVGDVQLRILHSLRNKLRILWPQTVEAWKALAIRATKSFLFDRWKKARRRAKAGDAGVVVEDLDQQGPEEAEAGAGDPLDHGRAVDLLGEFLAERKNGDVDARILECLTEELDQAEIAAELGLTHQQVRDRLRAMRAAFSAKAASILGAGLLAVFLLFLLRTPAPPRYYAPGPDVAFTEATPQEQSADLRELAKEPCRASDWGRCTELLDEAAGLDPEGDKAPEIQAVRDRIAQENDDQLRQREAKPHGVPQPPKAPKAPKAPQQP